MLKMNLLFIGVWMVSIFQVFTNPQPKENAIAEVYKALKSDNLENIQIQLDKLPQSALENKQAYEGALMMKKSGLLKGSAKQKLAVFKSGKTKLEESISKYPDNAEFRFLRLIIQENAPKVVKYNRNIDEDVEMIKKQYNHFPSYLQQIITDFSKNSKDLKLP